MSMKPRRNRGGCLPAERVASNRSGNSKSGKSTCKEHSRPDIADASTWGETKPNRWKGVVFGSEKFKQAIGLVYKVPPFLQGKQREATLARCRKLQFYRKRGNSSLNLKGQGNQKIRKMKNNCPIRVGKTERIACVTVNTSENRGTGRVCERGETFIADQRIQRLTVQKTSTGK